MAAGPAAVSRGCANLLELAVRHLVAVVGIDIRIRCLDALFAAVLPEADARESVSEVAIFIGAAKAVVAAVGEGPGVTRFTNRRRGAHAHRILASGAATLPRAFLDQIAVDVGAIRAESTAVVVFVTGPIDTDAEATR